MSSPAYFYLLEVILQLPELGHHVDGVGETDCFLYLGILFDWGVSVFGAQAPWLGIYIYIYIYL